MEFEQILIISSHHSLTTEQRTGPNNNLLRWRCAGVVLGSVHLSHPKNLHVLARERRWGWRLFVSYFFDSWSLVWFRWSQKSHSHPSQYYCREVFSHPPRRSGQLSSLEYLRRLIPVAYFPANNKPLRFRGLHLTQSKMSASNLVYWILEGCFCADVPHRPTQLKLLTQF